MDIRFALQSILRRVSRPGIVPENAFAPFPADKLINALEAEDLMNKSVDECTNEQIASAFAILTVCTLHQGGHDAGRVALAVERLLERLDHVEHESREQVRKDLEGFRTKIGTSLGFGFKPKAA